MKIGLIDVDGHRFPNLALMRISAFHKSIGDTVEWWWSDLIHYDIVYKSKIFSDSYSKDVPDPMNADVVIKGGSGYAISLVDGVEVYDKDKDHVLDAKMESMFPDYSIYPQYKFAISMTSRGCPRGCKFCHVAAKEGRCSKKVANVSDFWNGQAEIKCCDPNILACADWRDLLQQYSETGCMIDFNQGLDARLMTEERIHALNNIKLKCVHFAWDDMKQSDAVISGLKMWSAQGKIKDYRRQTVYCLCNFDTSTEEDLYRIYKIREMGYSPFVMLYNKANADEEHKKIQRWCNNKFIFESCRKFEDYDGKR